MIEPQRRGRSCGHIDGILMRFTPMKRPNDQRKVVTILLCLGAGAALVAGPISVRGEEFNLGGRVLKVPDGFTIERVAGPPLVDRPIIADFDEQGRLYVADSSGSNDKVAEAARGEAAPDRPARGHRRRRPVRQAAPSSPTR